MAALKILTAFNIEVELPLASFHRRLLAWLLDAVIWILYIYAAIQIMRMFSGNNRSGRNEEFQFIISVLLFLPVVTYHLACEIFLAGQSIGKKITSLKVVTELGGRPSISQYLVRWVMRTSDYTIIVIALIAPTAYAAPDFFWKMATPLLLLIADVILMNTTQKGQRLGDILAHTILVRNVAAEDLSNTVFIETAQSYKPQFPEALQLSDRDMNALKHILASSQKSGDFATAERAAQKVKSHLGINSSLSPFDFLEAILKDYNHLATHKEQKTN